MVAIIFILFAAGGDFGGQAVFEIAHQRFEAIKDGNDFFLYGERLNRDKAYTLQTRLMQNKIRTDGVYLRP